MKTLQMRNCLASVGLVVAGLTMTSAVLIGKAYAQTVEATQQNEIETLQEQSSELLQQGRWPEALKLGRRSLDLAERKYGPDHPVVAASLTIVGDIYHAQARPAEADPLLRRALIIRQVANNVRNGVTQAGLAAPAEPPADVAMSLNNLANAYRAAGRYDEAEGVLTMTISVYTKALGADHPKVTMTQQNLAVLYFKQSKLNEAEALVKRVPSIRLSLAGDLDAPAKRELATAAVAD
jgi:tetratricopeptide (TPR) repeat protein